MFATGSVCDTFGTYPELRLVHGCLPRGIFSRFGLGYDLKGSQCDRAEDPKSRVEVARLSRSGTAE